MDDRKWVQTVDLKSGDWTQSFFKNEVLIWSDSWKMLDTEWDFD